MSSKINLGWLADLLSNIPFEDGNARAQRRVWNFIGVALVDDPVNEWLTLTVTGDPDLALEASSVTTPLLQSPPTEELIINGQNDTSQGIRFHIVGGHMLSIGKSGGDTVVTIPAARTGFALGWVADKTTGPGSTTAIFGNGTDEALQPGGDITIETGSGGAGGLGGDLDINIGEDVGTVSAEARIRAGAQTLLTLAQRGANVAHLDLGSNASPIIAILRALQMSLIATGAGTAGGFSKQLAADATDLTTWGGSPDQDGRTFAKVQTTNATPAVVTVYTPANDRAVHVECRITAYQNNTTVATYTRHGTFRKAGGTVTKVAASAPHTGEDAAAWDVDLTPDGVGGIAATLTGAAATNITWRVYTTFYLGAA
jgi:hypothetical protein